MLRSPFPRQSCPRGFTLLEVVIAMAILIIGMSAMAALSATMIGRGRESKYMSLAGTLASEKLEDLNKWSGSVLMNPTTSVGVDNSDPEICVPTFSAGQTEGSISADAAPTTVTCNGITETVNYNDNVNIDVTDNAGDCSSGSSGCFAETTSTTTSGVTTYNTTYHSPDGTVQQNANNPTNMTFHRQWVIEANPTIGGTVAVGVRRITVKVTLLDASVTPGNVQFQMSLVRP